VESHPLQKRQRMGHPRFLSYRKGGKGGPPAISSKITVVMGYLGVKFEDQTDLLGREFKASIKRTLNS